MKMSSSIGLVALFLLISLAGTVSAEEIVYLNATFDDKTIDSPIGTGGPENGEPSWIDSNLSAVVRATSSARIGWSGLEIRSSDGRLSNVAPIFVYDPDAVTLIGWKTPSTAASATLEWLGGSPGMGGWTLERSTDPRFSAASSTTLYHGRETTATDPAPAAAIWFYRVR